MRPPQKLYEFHVKNLQAIEAAMERIAHSLRAAISTSDQSTVSAFVKLYAFLVGAWAECRFRKLLYEPKGFNESDRAGIQSKNTQLDKWLYAVELAFRKQYKITKSALSANTLDHDNYARYTTLRDLINNDLRVIIELRNKLAHGQWVYPLNNNGDDVAQEQMDALRNENLLSLQFKRSLLSYLSDIVHDLVVSQPTFERDFNDHYRKIVETRRNLQTRKYADYADLMIEKRKRGIAIRNLKP